MPQLPALSTPLLPSGLQPPTESSQESALSDSAQSPALEHLTAANLQTKPEVAQPHAANAEKCCTSSAGKHIANCCCCTGLTVLAGACCCVIVAAAGCSNGGGGNCLITTGNTGSSANCCDECLPYPEHWGGESKSATQKQEGPKRQVMQ